MDDNKYSYKDDRGDKNDTASRYENSSKDRLRKGLNTSESSKSDDKDRNTK